MGAKKIRGKKAICIIEEITVFIIGARTAVVQTFLARSELLIEKLLLGSKIKKFINYKTAFINKPKRKCVVLSENISKLSRHDF